MNQTDQQHLQWAWNNVPERHRQTPVMLAIGETLAKLSPGHENFQKNERSFRDLADRIGKGGRSAGTNMCFNAPACLDYESDWIGEWEIRNVDLVGIGYFRMWLQRAEIQTGAIYLPDRVLRAMRCKRMWQAYLRYQNTGLTTEHCALLSKMLWTIDIWRNDGVSLYVEGKRPFGNSSIASDIFEIVGWPFTWIEHEDDCDMPEEQEERAWNLFDELVFAAPDAAIAASESLNKPA